LGYLIFYFKLPKVNPWWGFGPIFLVGIISLFIDLFQGQPFITKSGGINWGIPAIGYLLSFSLFLFTFLPMSIILFEQSKIAQSSFLKTKALLFSLVAIGGFLVIFIEFILEPFFNLEETFLNETILILLNAILFIFLITSQRDFRKIE
ncbi:MAG: hypothetical protein ABIA02_00815, partial [Candidatus Falkowbacteria bacterium]